MKIKTLLVVLFCITLLSCSRENEPEDTPKQTVFKYKANGTLIEFKNPHFNDTRISVVREDNPPGTSIKHYILHSIDENIVNEINLGIPAPPATEGNWLTITTYEYVHPNNFYGGVKYNGINYWSFTAEGGYKITITKIHNGYADGTFSARLSNRNNPADLLLVTDGVFENLKIW